MKQLILAAFLSWPIFIPTPVHSQGALYKWTDSRGNIHYTNTPTSMDAKAVDDVLPPAANFTSPAKPTVAAKATPQSDPDTEGKSSPEEPSSAELPDDGSAAPADQEQTGETPSPAPPPPATTEQQPLTPAQQALRDSPAPMD